jgi:hypothetical protein
MGEISAPTLSNNNSNIWMLTITAPPRATGQVLPTVLLPRLYQLVAAATSGVTGSSADTGEERGEDGPGGAISSHKSLVRDRLVPPAPPSTHTDAVLAAMVASARNGGVTTEGGETALSFKACHSKTEANTSTRIKKQNIANIYTNMTVRYILCKERNEKWDWNCNFQNRCPLRHNARD